jgi:prefoldin subunit 5
MQLIRFLAATEDRLKENITKLNKELNHMTWKYQAISLKL